MPSKKTYEEMMFGDAGGEEIKALKKASFEKAHEIRKFEIELYWKRTLYFWGFQVSIVAGLIAITKGHELKDYLFIALASLGFVSSLAWCLANKGSKLWQENWELHIDALEKDFTGNLYKCPMRYESTSAYSVSKSNECISATFFVGWFIGLTYGIFNLAKDSWKLAYCCNSEFCLVVIILAVLMLAAALVCRYSKTNFKHSKSVKMPFYGGNPVIMQCREIERVEAKVNKAKTTKKNKAGE